MCHTSQSNDKDKEKIFVIEFWSTICYLHCGSCQMIGEIHHRKNVTNIIFFEMNK
mgnify:CR=1 FL=1